MRRILSLFFFFCLPFYTFADTIEGNYITQPESYRDKYGELMPYGASYEILISSNGDGTYYVDDLLGGWYYKRAGYGIDYCMTGNIEIANDGSVSLVDSYVSGWGDGLTNLTGNYDEETSTFTIVADYAGLKFVQTWVKNGLVFTKDGINYSIGENNTASVMKGDYSGDITIPYSVDFNGNSYKVTNLDDAFIGCPGLTSVSIPNSITTIGKGAFSQCRDLISVTIPNSVTSINGAFSGCTALESIILPTGLITIGDLSFNDCTSLTKIEIPNSVTSIGFGAFTGCSELTSLTLSNSLQTIDEQAFQYCVKLKEVELPEGITAIGESCFIGCNELTSLNIPKSLVDFGNCAFTECGNFESITVAEGNVKFDSRNNCNAIIETENNKLLLGCKNTIIPLDVNTIGYLAFAGCNDLESITIPDNVTSILDNAFWKCEGLKSFSAGSNVEVIEHGVFHDCGSLQYILLPETVNKIGHASFGECLGLKEFYIYAEKTPSTHTEAFVNTPIGNATLHVPDASLAVYKKTAPWSGFGSIVALTDDDPKVTGIHSYTKDDVSPINTYTLDGKRVQNPQRGISIIRMSDGTTKKVIKK